MRNAALAGAIAIALAGCGESISDITVPVGPHVPEASGTALSQRPAQGVRVEDFDMRRGTGVLPGRIGERKTVSDVSMGYVTMTPPPEDLLEDAIRAELKAAGHSHSDSNYRVRIDGEVSKFDFGTDVTALYWDVYVNAGLDLTVESDKGRTQQSYATRCSERTYTWPSESVIAGVISACVSDFGKQFSNDPSVAALF